MLPVDPLRLFQPLMCACHICVTAGDTGGFEEGPAACPGAQSLRTYVLRDCAPPSLRPPCPVGAAQAPAARRPAPVRADPGALTARPARTGICRAAPSGRPALAPLPRLRRGSGTTSNHGPSARTPFARSPHTIAGDRRRGETLRLVVASTARAGAARGPARLNVMTIRKNRRYYRQALSVLYLSTGGRAASGEPNLTRVGLP